MADAKKITQFLNSLVGEVKKSNVATFGNIQMFSKGETLSLVASGEVGVSLYTKKDASAPTSLCLLLPNGQRFFGSMPTGTDLTTLAVGDELDCYTNISAKKIKLLDEHGIEVIKDGYAVYVDAKDDAGKVISNLSLRFMPTGETYTAAAFARP